MPRDGICCFTFHRQSPPCTGVGHRIPNLRLTPPTLSLQLVCRELYAYEKKVRRAKAKKNRDLAARLAERRPTYRLDHLVRER